MRPADSRLLRLLLRPRPRLAPLRLLGRRMCPLALLPPLLLPLAATRLAAATLPGVPTPTGNASCAGGAALQGVCFQHPASFKHLTTVANASGCCNACRHEPRCAVWVFRPARGLNPGCLLKPEGRTTTRQDPLCTSGHSGNHPAIPPPPPPPPPPPSPLPPRDRSRKPPSYWCTWQAQSREWMQGAAGLDAAGGEAYWTAWRSHDPPPGNPTAGYSGWDKYLNSSYLFRNPPPSGDAGASVGVDAGESGWAYLFSPAARSMLYFSLDNQWAVPHTMKLDTTLRFPEFAGRAPSALGALTARIKELGWAGLSVWVPGGASVSELLALHEAGVRGG